MALGEAEAALGRPLQRRRVLCVGDGLPTDIRGANAQGLDVLFVANGIHGGETVGAEGSKKRVDFELQLKNDVCNAIAQSGVSSSSAMSSSCMSSAWLGVGLGLGLRG